MKEKKCLNCLKEIGLFYETCPKCGSIMHTKFEDDLFLEVARYVVDNQACSINEIQMKFNLKFNRASQLVDLLEKYGVVSESFGIKPRKVLVDKNELHFEV